MREILFRGKRTDNGEWVEGYYVAANYHWHKHGIHRDWIICNACANGGWFALGEKHPVIGNTVGQFTGLTDENGKKIFEGDIVCQTGADNRPDEYAVVRYGEFNCSCCHGVYGWFFEGIKYDFADIRRPEWHIIIGNIHDNPELVEVKDGKDE